MLKGGVVGLGKMGLSHAAIIGAHPDVNLAAVCDTSDLILNALKKYSTVKCYNDYERMLEDEALDFVAVATPTKYHYLMVKQALNKNIHTFCEKPFSLNISEGEELVKIAKERKLVNQVGYHNHFIGTFLELKRLIELNVIGEIVHFKGEAYGPVVVREKVATWRSKPQEGGGCLYDYASHVLNLIQEIVGRPQKVYGSLLKSIYSKGVEDAVYSTIILTNGTSGTLSVNWSDETYRKMSTSITVEGKNGKIICDATEIKIYLKKPLEKEKLDKGWTIKYITDFALPVNYYLRGEEYSAQIDYFIDSIKQNQLTQTNSFEKAWVTDKTIEMILKDAKTNY
jgi:predicted dehydrogenase